MTLIKLFLLILIIAPFYSEKGFEESLTNENLIIAFIMIVPTQTLSGFEPMIEEWKIARNPIFFLESFRFFSGWSRLGRTKATPTNFSPVSFLGSPLFSWLARDPIFFFYHVLSSVLCKPCWQQKLNFLYPIFWSFCFLMPSTTISSPEWRVTQPLITAVQGCLILTQSS